MSVKLLCPLDFDGNFVWRSESIIIITITSLCLCSSEDGSAVYCCCCCQKQRQCRVTVGSWHIHPHDDKWVDSSYSNTLDSCSMTTALILCPRSSRYRSRNQALSGIWCWLVAASDTERGHTYRSPSTHHMPPTCQQRVDHAVYGRSIHVGWGYMIRERK